MPYAIKKPMPKLVTKYIINESNRYCSKPYSGSICAEASVAEGGAYGDYQEAIAVAERLSKHSKVGFHVRDFQKVLETEFSDRVNYSRTSRLIDLFQELDPNYRFEYALAIIDLLSEEEQRLIYTGV